METPVEAEEVLVAQMVLLAGLLRLQLTVEHTAAVAPVQKF